MMAEKSRKNVVRLEVVHQDQIPPLRERRAAKALDLLCDAFSSPAAKSSGLSENEIINAIKKMKSSSLGEPRSDKQYTPVWNISTKQELDQAGLDMKEIEGLDSILRFGKSSHETNVSDQLIPEILFTLEILDYDEDKFQQFTSRLQHYPAIGVLLCEILTDSQLLEKAQQFLDRESTDQKRKILLEYLKENLTNLENPNIAHFVSSCGKCIATIVPKEIDYIKMLFIKVSESDATALATVISHSSVVKELNLLCSGLNSKSIACLQDGLKNSDVKICSLIISNNDGIDEQGFRCLGNIVKKHTVEELDMSECILLFGKLKSFDDTSGNAKSHSLDISYNKGIDEEGFRCLGNIVKKHAVEELNMSKCGLSFRKLKSFDDTSGNAKIRSLNISENQNLDEEGFHCLGNIVKNHTVEKLSMSDCGLSFGKLKSFNDASENAKIMFLDVSNNEDLNVNAICQLTLKVTESLIAKRWLGVWREPDIRELQDFIDAHPGDLKVTLDDCLPELESPKTSSKMSETDEEDSDDDGESRNVADVTPLKKHSAVKDDENSKRQSTSVNGLAFGPDVSTDIGASTPTVHHHYHHEHITNISNSTIGKISIKDGANGSDQSGNQKPGGEEIETQRDGWVELSGNIFMYNKAPLLSGTQVYKAKLRHANGKTKDVVVKLLPKDEKHKKEIDILLELDDHPNIVKIIYSGEFPGLIPQLYVVMEQCHQNLKQYIKGKKSCQLSILVPKAKSFFKQMISAIVFIHGRKIIHRDLKPSNILISADEESLKVADFGISREIPEDRTQVTVTNSEAGTDGYKPPEAHQGTRIGYKADVFQMGINGYYIFTTGQHPFGEDCNIQAVNIKSNNAPDFSEIHQLPGPLTSLLKGMLQHSPADRPSAEQALGDDFFNFGCMQGY